MKHIFYLIGVALLLSCSSTNNEDLTESLMLKAYKAGWIDGANTAVKNSWESKKEGMRLFKVDSMFFYNHMFN